jgi:tRNA threonylcarbamoyladenosine biosynthesis protein TsaB
LPAEASRAREVILAVDTCGARPAVALRIESRVVTAPITDRAGRADDAASLIARLLETTGVDLGEITGIGVTIGPGSYTGVRVGLALVRGLSLVDRVPVVGVSTLELLAAAAPGAAQRICPLLDAGSEKLYAAVFSRAEGSLREVSAPRVLARAQLPSFLDVEATDASVVRCEHEPAVDCGRTVIAVAGSRVGVLAGIAADRLRRGESACADRVLPLYVGATGARPNRNKVASPPSRDE